MTNVLRALAVVATAGCTGSVHIQDGGGPTPRDAGDRVTLEAEAREVRFEGEELTLEGTLTLPERTEGALVPAVVLVHGSGPNSRDSPASGQLAMSFGFDIRIFEQLALRLGDAGYAVLRYDKRTCGTFNGGCDNGYPTPDLALTGFAFVGDAAAGGAYLRSLPEIDPNRVFVLGHSQGGQLVPVILDQDPLLAGGVMVAAPHQPIDESVADQRDFLVELTGSEEGLETLTEQVEQLRALRMGTHDGSPISGASVEFWESMFALAVEAQHLGRTLQRPLFAVAGDYDWNVPPAQLAAWQAEFIQAPGPRGQQTHACVTHALNCISEPDYRRIDADDIGRELHAPLVDSIVAFLDAQSP